MEDITKKFQESLENADSKLKGIEESLSSKAGKEEIDALQESWRRRRG